MHHFDQLPQEEVNKIDFSQEKPSLDIAFNQLSTTSDLLVQREKENNKEIINQCSILGEKCELHPDLLKGMTHIFDKYLA